MNRLRSLALAGALLALPALTAACSSSQVDNDTCHGQAVSGSDPYYSEPATHGDPVGQQIPQMPHAHVAPPARVQYNHNPPTSGCHYNLGYGKAPIAAGFYATHVDAEYWVHNLEHGYIVIVYNCPSGCADDVRAIRQWMAVQGPDPGLQSVAGKQAYAKIIAIPWAFDHKFAAISWDYYDPMDRLDIDEIDRFYKNHIGESPENVSSQ